MTKFLLSALGLLLSVTFQYQDNRRLFLYIEYNTAWNSEKYLPCFVEAIAWKESNCNPSAIGDSGKAVGYLQLHPISVAEANRLAHTSYTLDDRFSREKSIEMFYIIQKYRNPSFDYNKALAIWNPGHPSYYRSKITERFYHNVRASLESSL